MTQMQPPPAGSPYPGGPPQGPYQGGPYQGGPPQGGNPYQGGNNPYQGGGNPYQGGNNPYQGGGNPYQGGPPPAGLDGPQPGYPPPAPRGTNTLAIVALVLAILVAPIGLILGIVALVQIRKRGDGGAGLAVAAIVVGALLTLITAAAVAVVALATPTLDSTALEGKIASTTQQEVGAAPTSVNCPDDVAIQAGNTFTCTASLDGQNLPFLVTQKDTQGNVDFQSQGWVATGKAVKALTDAATKNFPQTQWAATCADGKKVVVGPPGTTFSCTLSVSGGTPEQTEDHTVTIKDASGNIDIE